MKEIDPESDSSSSDRYRKLKKEEAGTHQNKAEKRFEELKQEAKQEFIEKQKEREEEEKREEAQDSGKFITY